MSKLATYGLLTAGLFFAAGSLIVGWFIFPAVLRSKITQTVRLEDGGETWKKWIDIPIPIYQKIFIYNITNPFEVRDKGAKPILQQVGPYTYQQKRVKEDIEVREYNDTVSYRQKVFYFYRPDLTVGSLEDKIWMINLPFVGLATKALREGGVARGLIQSLFANEHKGVQPVHELTVDEFLFKGQYLPFMEELAELKGEGPLMPNHTFGIYYSKNGSDPGMMEVYSGVQDSSKFGNIASWNEETSVPYWGNEYCNKINGSDGALFPPFVTKDRILPIFSPDLCRSLYLTFDKEETVKGLVGYRFTLPDILLEDPRKNEDNECFCTYRGGDDFKACPKRGAYQLESCKKGIPLVVSLPHFLDGDDEMRNESIGLSPIREEHETVITLEPNTGVLLKAHKRIQMNLELEPTKKFKTMKNLPKMIIPLFWADESAELTEESANRIYGKLISPQLAVAKYMWGAFALGCLLIVLGLILLIRQNRNSHKEKIRS